MSKDINDAFREKWIQSSVLKLRMIYPDDPEDQLTKFAKKMYDDNFKDTKCTIYNNYEREEIQTTISKTINWLDVRKPIVTESGSLFKRHDEEWNPNAIIIGQKLDGRAKAKKEKFKYANMGRDEEDPEKKAHYYFLSAKKDLEQGRIKVIVNSEYGVSGLSSSWFFNMACASATTARGQALISTAFNAFEDFIGDGVMFQDMDECITFVYNTMTEEPFRELKDSEWVNDKSEADVFVRLRNKFAKEEDCDPEILNKILSGMSQENLNRIYYKSNLYEFIRNSTKARSYLTNIVMSKKEFMEPLNPPKEIAKYVDKLRRGVIEYVHYNYQFNDRLIRLKSHRRNVVLVIDTDSNFLNFGPWVDFVADMMSNYTKIESRNRVNGRILIDARDKFKSRKFLSNEQNVFRIVNTLINMTDEMINTVLADFLDRSNIPEDNPGVTKMKNEFFYTKILIMNAKKHYQAVMRLQEGNLIPNDINKNLDIKGQLGSLDGHLLAVFYVSVNCWETLKLSCLYGVKTEIS